MKPKGAPEAIIGAMDPEAARAELESRLTPPKRGPLDIDAPLHHFALITYAVPAERLTRHIPRERFEIPTFEVNGEQRALLSVVPFIDAGFRFRLLPFARFHFAQTNYRVYVIDRETGQHCVWFFGTTLGGWPVHLARLLWKIPWHPAKYAWRCRYDDAAARYVSFIYRVRSEWGDARVELRDTGEPAGLLPGFGSMEEQTLILTHPLEGYFYRLDDKLGTYLATHDVLQLTTAEAVDLRFDLLERLGVLTPQEMRQPHSALIARETVFHIQMPPRRLS